MQTKIVSKYRLTVHGSVFEAPKGAVLEVPKAKEFVASNVGALVT